METGTDLPNLIVLAADKHIAASLEILIGHRHADLGICPITFDVRRHPESDPGCRTKAAEFLRPFINQYCRALVIFDQKGCGSGSPRDKIQNEVETALNRNGWAERSRAIVIAPELESWVWSPAEDVADALGWGRDFALLRNWLRTKGLWPAQGLKPDKPKEALEQALRHKRKVRSSALFTQLAASVQFTGCRDPAFTPMLQNLEGWRGMEVGVMGFGGDEGRCRHRSL